MTVVSVTAIPLSHRYPTPPGQLAMGVAYKKDMVLVKVVDDSGMVGYGESHHSLSPTTIAEHVNTTLAALVVGEDPHNTEGIWQKIYRRAIRTHSLGAGAVSSMSGIDMALWDLRGKLLGVPVYQLLGGSRRELNGYAGSLTLGFQPPDELEEEVRRLIAERGFKAVKLRIGDSLQRDIERVRHIRQAFGPELNLMVDANTNYDFVDLYRLIPVLEESAVTWLEEPLPPEDIAGLSQLRQKCNVPIAVGENLHGRRDFLPVLEARAVDVLQPDPSKCGGITELKKVADLAALYHLKFAPHASHSALNHASILHVLSATPAAYYYEGTMTENPFARGVISGPVFVTDGVARAPEGPGLGVEVDESQFGDYVGIPGPAYRF